MKENIRYGRLDATDEQIKEAAKLANALSTIKNADKILAIEEGQIIEQGTHEKLMDEKGFYANLYYSQFSQEEALG